MDKMPYFSEIKGELYKNKSLAPLTWFKVGGPAEYLFIPKDKADLIRFLKKYPGDYPKTIVGAGSNILIREGGISGVVISMKNLNAIKSNEENIYAETGALDMAISREASKMGLSGLEFLIGIPGSIGGGLKMNAGSYGREIKDVLVDVEVIDNSGSVFHVKQEELKLEYRKNNSPNDWIFLSCNLKGKKSETSIVRSRMKEIINDRKNNQPINQLTGGSTFKNPKELKSWRLIDKAGCRGLIFGNAKVSEKHCNFLINNGNALSSDIENLGEIVRHKVFNETGVNLEWEIIRVGKRAQTKKEDLHE